MTSVQELYFDDDQKVDKIIYDAKAKEVILSFGSGVINWDWQPLDEMKWESFSLEIQPYNKLNSSFVKYFSTLPITLESLTLRISSLNQVEETLLIGIGENLKRFINVRKLDFMIHDTKNMTQKAFDQICSGIASLNLETLILDFGNNHHVRNYSAFYSVKKVKNMSLNFGARFTEFVQEELFNSELIMNLKLHLGKNCQTKSGYQKQIKIPYLTIQYSDYDDISDNDLLEILQQYEGYHLEIKAKNKHVILKNKTLQISIDSTNSINELLNQISNVISKIKYLQVNVLRVLSNVIEHSNINTLQQLDVFQIVIKRIIGFNCASILDFYGECFRGKQWYYISFEVLSKCVLQYSSVKKQKNHLSLQVNQGVKMGAQGEEQIAKILSLVDAWKLRLTILMDNGLTAKGIRNIGKAVFCSNSLEKCHILLSDQLQVVTINKVQAAINQYIKDKQHIQQTYCNLIAKQYKKYEDQFSIDMLSGVADYLIDDISLPQNSIQNSYHGQQFGYGVQLFPTAILELFQ